MPKISAQKFLYLQEDIAVIFSKSEKSKRNPKIPKIQNPLFLLVYRNMGITNIHLFQLIVLYINTC
jgi:hypothetical protein